MTEATRRSWSAGPRPRRKTSGGTGVIVVFILIALMIGGVVYLSLSQMADIADKPDEFLRLHDAAMDRMSKGEASEYGPEVIEEYAKAAAKRKEQLLMIQPDLPARSSKSCGNCGRAVPSSSKAGGKCPHCRARWLYTSPVVTVRRR